MTSRPAEEEGGGEGQERREPDRGEGKGAELLTKLLNGSTKHVTRRIGQILRVADAIMNQELRHLFVPIVQVAECDPFYLNILC